MLEPRTRRELFRYLKPCSARKVVQRSCSGKCMPMNSSERAFAVFVAVIAAIGISLTLTLFVFVTASFGKGLLLTLLICVPFGLVIALGLRQHRARKVLPPLSIPSHDNFLDRGLYIPLQETLGKFERQGRQFLWIGLVAVLSLNLIFFFKLAHTGNLMWGLLIANGFLAFIGMIVIPIHDSIRRKALRLLAPFSERYMRADAHGMTIPIEIVTEPALHIAVESEQTEVSITWSEIKHWEVSDGMGSSPAQHSISVSGNALGGAFGRFGLIRTPEILRQEEALLVYARQRLSCKIVFAAVEPPMR